MPRESIYLREVTRILDSPASAEEKSAMISNLKRHFDEGTGVSKVDQIMITRLSEYQKNLKEAQEAFQAVRKEIDKLTDPPHHPAVLWSVVETDKGPRAMVLYNNTRSLVSIAEEVALQELNRGQEILLNHQRNILLGPSPCQGPPVGETALFDRLTGDGYLVLTYRDEEVVVAAARSLDVKGLKKGDRVRFNASQGMAFEKIERSKGEGFFLEETPVETFADLGGLEEQERRLKRALTLHFKHKDIVTRYRLKPIRGIILQGPPGTGKTSLARALANYAASLFGSKKALFMNWKPGATSSMWYGMSEALIRERFSIAREASLQNPDLPVVIFMDEIDGLGSARGDTLNRVNDRVLQALMAELDGLEERGNILVVAATNRADTLDPGLVRPGRLGDLILDVPRPDLAASKEIFSHYLWPEIPYADLREEIAERAVSATFAPNGDSDLAIAKFRDGRSIMIKRRDLVSGALIEQAVALAREIAAFRDIESGRPGLEAADLLEAMDDCFASISRLLTPLNLHKHVAGLPHDAVVVSVERIRRRVSRPHRYLNIVSA